MKRSVFNSVIACILVAVLCFFVGFYISPNAQGEPGIDGIDGATPYIGANGNWFIDGEDTGYPSRGEDGTSTSVLINSDGYWVIDGVATDYRAEGDTDYLRDILQSVFDVQDKFVSDYETLKNPSWNYTSSTFSGWGGSIGKPATLEALAIRVRARDNEITRIKFHLNQNDKNGESIASEVLNVSVPAGEEQEIVWVLPQTLTDNTDFLYLSFNCDELCDAYSNFGSAAIIPTDEYQAVMSYTTNGKLLDSASKMTDVSSKPCRYIYAKIGSMQEVFVPKESAFAEKESVNVFLPDEYDIAVNDNFQLFYRGVVQAVNPYNYSITVTCAKGKAYPRYFEWTPTESDIGSHKLTVSVYDDNGKKLGTDSTVLNVHSPKETAETQNVLCIGDSLTSGGYWPSEAYRRFSETGGTPEGLGLDYLNFIGTCKKQVNGKTVGYEGYGGWTWKKYCSEDSPFYDKTVGDISFRSYCDKNGFDGIDVVYILLTWNGQGEPWKTDYKLDEGHFVYAKKLIDKLHGEYPEATVRCMGIQMPSQNGGMGASYGANGGYSDDYGMLVTAMNYNAALEDFCQQAQYRDFVKYVDIAGQFDTDYNMPSADKPVNNRNDTSETVGTNGVHPTVGGYYQIADAVFRSLCEVFGK